VTSCAVAYGLKRVAEKMPVTNIFTKMLTKTVPLFAVVTAGIVNVFLMRSNEIR
jgi:hypothetical protein